MMTDVIFNVISNVMADVQVARLRLPRLSDSLGGENGQMLLI